MRVRGFITLPLMGYVAIGGVLVILGLGIALKIESARLHSAQSKYDTFVAQTRALGEAARKEAVMQTAADMRNKERADADEKRRTLAHVAELARVRDANPASSFVPAATAGSKRPDLISFDRAEYLRADGAFTAGARGLADEGSAATIDLDTVKEWAHGR